MLAAAVPGLGRVAAGRRPVQVASPAALFGVALCTSWHWLWYTRHGQVKTGQRVSCFVLAQALCRNTAAHRVGHPTLVTPKGKRAHRCSAARQAGQARNGAARGPAAGASGLRALGPSL